MLDLFEKQVADGELAKESQSSDLIPAGKYPFTVTAGSKVEVKESFTNKDGSITPNPLHGHEVARLEIQLNGVSPKGFDELDGKTRKYWVNVCFDVVKDAKDKLKKESKLGGDMAAVSGLTNPNEIVNYFTTNKAVISIGKFDAQTGPMNLVYGISKLA